MPGAVSRIPNTPVVWRENSSGVTLTLSLSLPHSVLFVAWPPHGTGKRKGFVWDKGSGRRTSDFLQSVPRKINTVYCVGKVSELNGGRGGSDTDSESQPGQIGITYFNVFRHTSLKGIYSKKSILNYFHNHICKGLANLPAPPPVPAPWLLLQVSGPPLSSGSHY